MPSLLYANYYEQNQWRPFTPTPNPVTAGNVWLAVSFLDVTSGNTYKVRVTTPGGTTTSSEIAITTQTQAVFEFQVPTGPGGAANWDITLLENNAVAWELSYPMVVSGGAGGIPKTVLVVLGVTALGGLVYAMTRKKK